MVNRKPLGVRPPWHPHNTPGRYRGSSLLCTTDPRHHDRQAPWQGIWATPRMLDGGSNEELPYVSRARRGQFSSWSLEQGHRIRFPLHAYSSELLAEHHPYAGNAPDSGGWCWMFLWRLDGNFDWAHSKSQFLIDYFRLPISPPRELFLLLSGIHILS